MRKIEFYIGILSFILVITGVICKIFSLAYSFELVGIGLLLFLLGFSITLFRLLAHQSRKALQISTIILFIGIEAAILAMLFKLYHLPMPTQLGILSMVLFYVWWIFYSNETEGRKLQLRKDRQLAAILFTDIVGFTSMMGEDEDMTLAYLAENRKIQKQVIRKHRGKWLKEMGDGSLVIFYTATEALAAALEMQSSIQKLGKFSVRMGIHISEIVFTDTDVFGDGVNIASRISDKAKANEICISDTIFQNIRNRENLKITPLGEIELKNVTYPLNIYKIETSDNLLVTASD